MLPGMDDFIEIYDGALTPGQCQQILARFEASGKAVRGKTGQGVDVAKKDSYDLTISQHAEWNDVSNLMMASVLTHLSAYMDKYRMLLTGALSPRVADPESGQPVTLNIDNFERCGRPYLAELIQSMYRCGPINVQKYLQASGGYHHWHSEIYPQNASCETLHRALLFQFYLNDVAEGGETEFFYQRRKVEARQGRLIIAPAGFTHPHTGNGARGGNNLVATGCSRYPRADARWGAPA